MRVFSLDDIRQATRPAASNLIPPLTPAAYIALRRKAHGLSIERVANLLSVEHAYVLPDVVDVLRQLEAPGVRARHRETIEALARVIPLDVDVYYQLADEPADRHPTICRSCGCSAGDPCTGDRGVCSIDFAGACTRCAEVDAHLFGRAA